MDDYDEDLSENPWYLAFIQNHNQLFLDVTDERWIICVPRSGSWKGGNDAPKNFSSTYFESHCIKFEGEEVSQTKKDGDGPPAPKHVNKYLTHNGKTLLIARSKMTCGAGFEDVAMSFDSRSGHVDLPPSGLNHSAKILFEETYFNANDQSYKMLCISRPLELHLSLFQDTAHGVDDSPLSPTSDESLVSDKLRRNQLWSKASKPEKLKRNVDVKISAYIKNHGSGKSAAEQILLDQSETEVLEMDEITGLDACVASVNILFGTCLQIVMKDSKIKKETETNPLDNTRNSLEKYVLQEVHGSVFRQISSAVATQEASFNKMICNLSEAQPRDLQVDERYWLSLPRAKRHLSRINKYCTPQDKLSCVQQTIACITAKQGLPENVALGSDDLLPILIYLLIKSNIPNWITNLAYLQHFQLVQSANEQQSFYIATLEAAIEHIKSGGQKILSQSVKSDENVPDISLVQQYFADVLYGDVAAVREILSKSATERKESEQKMCHPLCTCENCIKLKRRTATRSESVVTVHTRNDRGQTALHIAATAGHHEMVDALVEHRAELNATDYHGATPLHCAALAGSQSVVFLLLHYGANPNATDNNSNTPLHLCSQRGHEACAKAFLYFDPSTHVVSVDMENDEGDRPLHVASKWGYIGIIAALLECGANPKATNRRRQTSYDLSLNDKVSSTIKTAAMQVIRIVRTLKHLQQLPLKEIEYSSDNTQEKVTHSRVKTPKELTNMNDSVYVSKQVEKLFRAVNDNDVNMVKFLCGWQTAEDNENSKLNDPPCHPLCQCTKCQPLSHEHVLHANSSNQEKYTGLMLAAKNSNFEIANMFLEQGASVSCRTKKHGLSPLHFACESGSAEIVRLILSQDGANPDVRDGNGSTPLYTCAINNFPECAVILLEGNSSVNIRNRSGDTPLHVAVKWKNGEVIKLLLEHGALAYYKNNDGLTPVDLADKYPAIKSLVLTASTPDDVISPDVTSTFGVSPHSPFSEVSNQSTNNESATTSTLQKEDSQSFDDEAIANNLYAQYKDPAPPTPPISTQGSTGAENLESHDQLIRNFTFEENDSTGTSEGFDALDAIRQFPSTKSITSDIFCDLLQDVPVSQHEKDSLEPETETAFLLGSSGEDSHSESYHSPAEESKMQPLMDVAAAGPGVDEVLGKSAGDTYFEIG